MNEPENQENQQRGAGQEAASEPPELTVDQVEEQIREAEALHRSLTEKLGATASK